MNNLTGNTNFLTPIGFKLSINSNSYSNTEYFITSVTLPTVNAAEVPTSFRNKQGYVPGEKVIFDTLTVRMLIAENMDNYNEILTWINNNTIADKLEYCDMMLTIMSSSSTANKQLRFKSAFPVSISGVEFNVQNADIEYLQSDVSFRFDSMEFVS